MPVYLGLIAAGNDRLETVRGEPQVIEFVLYPPAYQSRGSLAPQQNRNTLPPWCIEISLKSLWIGANNLCLGPNSS